MAVGHRKDDVGFVRTGKRQLHHLFERNLLSLDYPRPRVDDDLERLGRLGRGDEPFDARSGEVNDIGGLDQQIFAPTHLQEDRFIVADIRQRIESGTTDRRLAPRELMIVQRQFEVAVGLEGDEPFGTPLAQIKRLIKPDILEIAGRQDGKRL